MTKSMFIDIFMGFIYQKTRKEKKKTKENPKK